jgi:hypothetical protein
LTIKRTLKQQNTFGPATESRSYTQEEIADVELDLLSKAGEQEYWPPLNSRPEVLHNGGNVINLQHETRKLQTDKASKILATVERLLAEEIDIPNTPTVTLFQHKDQIKRARRSLSTTNDPNYKPLSNVLESILKEINARRQPQRDKRAEKRQLRKAQRLQAAEAQKTQMTVPDAAEIARWKKVLGMA